MNEKYQNIYDSNENVIKSIGIVILKPTRKSDFIGLRDYLEAKYDDIMVQNLPYVDDDKNIIPFIRYAPYKRKSIKDNNLKRNAQKAYAKGDYDKAIELLKILVGRKFPNISDYALLGLSYLKKKNVYGALPYLEIATSFSIKHGNVYDFSELINKIRFKNSDTFENEDSKYYVKVTEEEFNNSGIIVPNLNIVIYLMQTGMDILEACKHAKLSFEEIQLLYLFFAEEYYKTGSKAYGDYYLKYVKDSKNKSDRVKKEIKRVESKRTLLLNKKVAEEELTIGSLKRVKPPKIEN